MACPQVARFVTKALQNNIALDDLKAVKNHFWSEATPSKAQIGNLSKLREGVGRLQILENLDRYHQISSPQSKYKQPTN